jgi:hypothetical protein
VQMVVQGPAGGSRSRGWPRSCWWERRVGTGNCRPA